MKKECEELFIELVDPYLTALQALQGYKKDDWHAVYKFAHLLGLGLLHTPIESIHLEQATKELIKTSLSDLTSEVTRLAEIALDAEHQVMHDEEPSVTLTNEAMMVLGSIQGKLREVIIDNVCACERGKQIAPYQVGKFPQQDKTLLTLRDLAGGYKITQVHDDGDLTVEADGKTYVVTTDGKFCNC